MMVTTESKEDADFQLENALIALQRVVQCGDAWIALPDAVKDSIRESLPEEMMRLAEERRTFKAQEQ